MTEQVITISQAVRDAWRPSCYVLQYCLNLDFTEADQYHGLKCLDQPSFSNDVTVA
jgi:hypothetical protein